MLMIYTGHLILFLCYSLVSVCRAVVGEWIGSAGEGKRLSWSPNNGVALDLWLEMGYSVMKGAHLVTPDLEPSCTLYTQSWTVSSPFHSKHHLHLLVGPITKVWSQALGHFQNCSIIWSVFLTLHYKIGYFEQNRVLFGFLLLCFSFMNHLKILFSGEGFASPLLQSFYSTGGCASALSALPVLCPHLWESSFTHPKLHI